MRPLRPGPRWFGFSRECPVPRITLILLNAALAATAALAQPVPCPVEQSSRVMSLLPPDVEAVVTVTDAARQRSSPAGRALLALTEDSGRLAETLRAWREFSRVLGWDAPSAFDELLGRRVTLVMRGVGADRVAEWAVLSEISPEAERRLYRSLRPAPRGIVNGLPVLAVENGRYELIVSRTPVADARVPRAPATMLIAPSTSSRLFDDLAPLVASSFPRSAPADVFVLVRRPGEPLYTGGPAQVASAALTAALDADGRGWTARSVSTSTAPRHGEEIVPWSRVVFEAIQEDSLVAMMGVVSASPLWDVGELLGLPRLGPLPHTISSLFGQRVALLVREVGPSASAAAPLTFASRREDTPALPPRAPAREPALAVTLAVETRNLPRIIATGDTIAASVVPVLNGQPLGGMAVVPYVEYDAGLTHDSIRAVRLAPEPRTIAAACGPAPMLTWGYGRTMPRLAQLIGAKTPPPATSPGWWVLSIVPEATADRRSPTESLRDLLARERPDPLLSQRLSVGVVRPARLDRFLHVLDPGLAEPVRGARWIDSISWDLWLSPDGSGAVCGELNVTMDVAPLRTRR